MKNTKMIGNVLTLAAIFAAFGASLSAHAANYTELYRCFNRVQLTDGPAVSIVEDENQQQYVQVENRGVSRYIALTPARAMILDGAILEASGIEVAIHNGVEEPALYGATVTFKSLDLTYSCTRN